MNDFHSNVRAMNRRAVKLQFNRMSMLFHSSITANRELLAMT
jgi:hypothetical protein